MRVEGGDGNAGERPDVVEIDLAGQHVHERLVGLGRDHGDDMLALMAGWRAEARCAGIGVAADAEGELLGLYRGDPGIEGRADGEQLAVRDHRRLVRLMLRIDPHAVAPDGQRRRLLVHELADTGLAAFGIDDRLGKMLALALEPCGHALRPASAHRIERAPARLAATGPVELPEDALEERVLA